MIQTIRLHSFTDANKAEWGDTNCDFRGTAFVGDKEGDGHKTLIEFDVDDASPEGQALIDFVLTEGPAVNVFEQGIVSKVEAAGSAVITGIAGILGSAPSAQLPNVRWGVWSKVAEGN